MNFKKAVVAIAIVLGMTSQIAHAQNASDNPVADSSSMKAAQDQLAASFNGMSISGFGESPVKGIYEVKTGSNILYFHPGEDGKKGVLIFGEMYDSSGVNLTEQSKMNGLTDTLKGLPLDSAITIGPKNAPVVYEFTDPDCPYCHAYHEWMNTYSKEHPVQRKLIFFNAAGHPLAEAKMKHVICSDDKDSAYQYVFSNELPHSPDNANALQMAKQKALKTCKEADEVLAKHSQIVSAVGVNGTPSFLFNVDTKPNLIVGFNQQKIAAAITELEKPAVTKLEKPSAKPAK
ncbi:DsbC family protein [Salmonella enterica]|uniref:DsbC family protein n=1 Tax=Enterobacteriaceae TaxID=543 RepID=UPI0010788B74|nr:MULTISPECIES: DsbC family protein [Enterobacteriaceae]EAB2651729.1 DsbC family protein [Salmonella enterica]ECD6215506.1 DsbC family protein [Salmonella enterica subsp. enterica serovar Enteritidis]MCU3492994.1 DsbC family protein [Enterobacter hormaechei subsp. steigerwaltii]BBV33440.1 protein disulfide-isomerase [Citrobacter freundii]EBR6586880.1 DsbC family protein [Salmonella enterica]